MLNSLKLFLWSKKYIFLFIGIFSIVLSQRLLNYNGLKSTIGSDGAGYYAYLPAVVIYQDFHYDFFQNKDNHIKSHYNPGFESFDGKALNKYYCGVSICLLPFFLAGIVISAVAGTDINGYTDTFLMLVSIASIFYFLLSTYLLSKVAKFFSIPEWVNIVTCLIFFSATNLFHYIVQEPSMSHTYCFFGVSLFLYAFVRLIEETNRKNLLFAASALGLLILIRPTNAVIFLFIPFFFDNLKAFWLFITSLFTHHLKDLVPAIILLFSIIGLQFLTYYLQTGHFFVYAYQKESFDFSHPQIINSLFSYKGGLFLYTPIIFVMFLFILFSKGSWYKKAVFLMSFSVFIYIISSWWCWWYGGSFSNRAFIDVFPLFIILGLYIYGKSTFKYKKLIFLISIPFIFANQIMAYQYKSGFMGSTDITAEKYWDLFLNPSLSSINEKIRTRILASGTILKSDSINFESLNPEERIVPEGYNSKMACVVGEKDNFCNSLNFTMDGIDVNKPIYLYVECMVKQDKENQDLGLCVAVEEHNDLKRWIYLAGNLFKPNSDGWKKATTVVKFEKGELNKNSFIKTMVNANHNRNLADNLKYMVVQLN